MVRVLLAAVLALSIVGVGRATADADPAQPGPPSSVPPTSCPGYPGCPPTTRPPRALTIELDRTSGPSGTRVGVDACGYDPGAAGRITLDGEAVIASVVAAADGCMVGEGPTSAAGSFQLVSAARGRAASHAHFTVPSEARPGSQPVCSVASGYETVCAPFRVTGGGGRVGGLAFTGTQLGLLLAIALALIVIGGSMWRRAVARRRRPRSHARPAERVTV
ncbi:MAG: hypothetical protein ACRD29_02680 [Acidimicrobiales bacterium]